MDKIFKTSDIYMVRLARVEKIVWSPSKTFCNVTYKRFPYTYYAKVKKSNESLNEYEVFSNYGTLPDIKGDIKEGDMCIYLKIPISMLLKESDKKTIKLSTLMKAERELNCSVGAPLGKETPAQLANLFDKKQEKVRQY